MSLVIKTFRIFDDANSEVRIYRPGMTISGADAQHAAAIGNIEADGGEKAKPAPSNKARAAAPENKSKE